MNLTLITPPSVEPITLKEAKNFIIWDDELDTSSNDYLTSLLKVARQYCENYQHRAYITQVWEASYDYWPSEVIYLPKGKLQSVDSVKYTSSNGSEIELSLTTDYVYSTKGILGRLAPAFGKSWPTFTPYPLDAVTIRFTCGYGDSTSSVPSTIKQAMQLLICHWFENRLPISELSTSKEIEFAVTSLLTQERIPIL